MSGEIHSPTSDVANATPLSHNAIEDALNKILKAIEDKKESIKETEEPKQIEIRPNKDRELPPPESLDYSDSMEPSEFMEKLNLFFKKHEGKFTEEEKAKRVLLHIPDRLLENFDSTKTGRLNWKEITCDILKIDLARARRKLLGSLRIYARRGEIRKLYEGIRKFWNYPGTSQEDKIKLSIYLHTTDSQWEYFWNNDLYKTDPMTLLETLFDRAPERIPEKRKPERENHQMVKGKGFSTNSGYKGRHFIPNYNPKFIRHSNNESNPNQPKYNFQKKENQNKKSN